MNQPAMPPAIEWNIQKVLEWTTTHFKSHQIDSPRITAEVLLAHALRFKRIDLYLRYDQPLSAGELAAFKELVRRRLRHEPVAYITGQKEFWSLNFAVSPAVLIPRPDTECLVEAALAFLPKAEASNSKRILELGTGSGAIIAVLALERPGHVFFALEKSRAAIGQAQANCIALGVGDTIHLFCSDWFAALKQSMRPFDLILSNPPYIARGDISSLSPEITDFEPRLALDGDLDGLSALRQIIYSAPQWLKPGGKLLLEIGFDQGPAVEEIARQCREYDQTACLKDYGGRDRVMSLTRV